MIELLAIALPAILTTLSGILTASAPFIVKAGFNYISAKTNIAKDEARERKLTELSIDAIHFVEEEAAFIIKKNLKTSDGSALLGIPASNTKMEMATIFVTKKAPEFSTEEIREKVQSRLPRHYGIGATSKPAIDLDFNKK